MVDDRGPRHSVPLACRGALKRSVRTAGVVTSSHRPPADFLIIGAKRGGTTSFYYDLTAHPAVLNLYPPPLPYLKTDATKGTHFFDSNFHRGVSWYRSYFPLASTRARVSRREGVPAIAGEASPFYLFHPAAAARAHSTVPHARIVALLRDPVMRTYSHWKERRRAKAEELPFVQALDAEPARLAGERERLLSDPHYLSYPWEQQSYFTQSLYAAALRPWLEAFGRGQVFVATSEDYYAEPDRVLGEVQSFLGLPRTATSRKTVRNAAEGEPLPLDVKRELQARFAEPNRELADLLDRGFPW